MSWATAKAALASKLETLAITAPLSLTVSRVYQTPPGALSDTPALVMFPPSVSPIRHPGGVREDRYKYRVRLFVYDQDKEVEALILENFVVAALDLFDNTLSQRVGGVQIINGPEVDEPGITTIGSRTYSVVDMTFDIRLSESKTFG